MTEAMQITVSSEMANRMDDSSSTPARRAREPDWTRTPWVVSDMEIKGQEAKKKGGAIVWMDPPFLGLFIGGWFRVASKRSHPMRQRNSA